MEHSYSSAVSVEEERQLFERFLSDATVVGEVYDRHADALFGFLVKRCGQKELAEDLVSQTFTKLIESRTSLRWQGVPLRAWLYHVASNALIDHARRASTKRDLPLDTDEWDPPSADNPAWTAEVRCDTEQVREYMKQLSARDQEVLDLKFFGELETQEIAALLNVSLNHAAVLVYRALGRLRQKMTKLETPPKL